MMNSNARKMRIVTQVLSFLLFVVLIKMKQPMNWMMIFVGSAVLALVFSRFTADGSAQ